MGVLSRRRAVAPSLKALAAGERALIRCPSYIDPSDNAGPTTNQNDSMSQELLRFGTLVKKVPFDLGALTAVGG